MLRHGVLEHEVLKATMKGEYENLTYYIFLNVFFSDFFNGNGTSFFLAAKIGGVGDPPTLLTPFLKHSGA